MLFLYCLPLAALLSMLLFAVQPASAGQVLDEQYGPDNLEGRTGNRRVEITIATVEDHG